MRLAVERTSDGTGPARPKRDLPTRLILGAMLLGVAARSMGLSWGLPDQTHVESFHPDEVTVYGHAAGMVVTGDLDPHFFNYGSLPLMLGAAALAVTHTAPPASPASGHLALRVVSMLAGVLTVWLVSMIATRLFRSRWAGLAAALFCAVAPVHAMCSQFATVDVLAASLLTASFACSVRILDEDKRRWYVLAGLFAGLSAACKYVGVVALVPALAAHMLRSGRARSVVSEGALLLALSAGLAFVLGCPYALLDSHAFVRDFLFEWRHVREGGTTALLGEAPIVYFASQVMPCGLTWPLLLAWIAAAAAIAIRRTPRELLALGWALLVLVLHGTGREIFVRYLVAAVPFLAVTFGVLVPPVEEAIRAGTWRSRPWSMVAGALGAGALVYALLVAWATGLLMSGPDTRELAAAALRPSLGEGSSLGFATPPWFYTPPILRLNSGPRADPKAFFREADEKGIDLAITGWDTGVLDLKEPALFVVTEFEYHFPLLEGDPKAMAFFSHLEAAYEPPIVVSRELRLGALVLPRPRLHDWRYVCPEIRIYRRRTEPQP